MSDETEKDWIAGHAAAWRSILKTAMRELGEDLSEAERTAARLVAERHGAVVALRRICTDHGDNDWPDNLHLADAIEKHLGRYLDE